MLLPTTCPVCHRPGTAPCARCWRQLRAAPSLATPPGLDGVAALLAYEGAGRELVARLKHRNARSVVPWLAHGMAGLVAAAGGGADVITWIPATPAHRRERGFDHAELLARALAPLLGAPARRLLARERDVAQAGLPASQRRAGPRLAPARAARCAASVLVVDDVLTTGATLAAAARVLRAAGAMRVVAAVAARTPLKPVSPESETLQ